MEILSTQVVGSTWTSVYVIALKAKLRQSDKKMTKHHWLLLESKDVTVATLMENYVPGSKIDHDWVCSIQ